MLETILIIKMMMVMTAATIVVGGGVMGLRSEGEGDDEDEINF